MKFRVSRPAAHLFAILPLFCLTLGGEAPAAAASFTNLNFEQATVVVNDPMFGHLDWNLALPGWEPWSSTVFLGSGHLGMGPLVQLIDDDYVPPPPITPQSSMSGRFTVLLRGGMGDIFDDVWLAQTGDVPSTARAIELLVLGDEPEIYLDGVRLTLVEIDEPGSNRRFAGNVLPFAGTTAELKILYPNTPIFDEEVGSQSGRIDDIEFTRRLVVPEPSTLAMALLGLVAASIFRLRRS